MTTVYQVTGLLRTGKRFPCMQYSNKLFALSINLYQGSIWEVTDGERKLIKRVYN